MQAQTPNGLLAPATARRTGLPAPALAQRSTLRNRALQNRALTALVVVTATLLLLTPLARALDTVPLDAVPLDVIPLGTVRVAQVQDAIEAHIRRELAVTADESARRHDAAGSTYAEAIAEFYRDRNYAPVWLDNIDVLHLAQLGRLAEMHGLRADDYATATLAAEISLRMEERNVAELARLDVLASRRIALLAVHLAHGKIDPRGKQVRLQAPPPSATIRQLLQDAARSESLLSSLDNLAPRTPLYRTLRLTLARERQLTARGAVQPLIAAGTTLEPGMVDARVPALRARLGVPPATANSSGDASNEVYDAELAAAVAAFQARHRLRADGLVGPATRRELNVSRAERIDQLRVNLDWQRWLAPQLESDYLYINIPHFMLYKIESGERVAAMRTQVGKRSRQTPVLSSTVDAIMANPSWTVPPTIFREDILPQLRNDPGFLHARGMRVIDSSGRTIDSSNIDWRQTSADNFPYRLRARPGDDNALGRMKFLIPNPYLIYLHDTPSRHLFTADNRALSSGCIRVEDPEALARWLVQRQQDPGDARLQAALATDKTRFLGLDQPVPVVIAYATVDLDADGELVFAADIYGKDAAALAVLDEVPPLAKPLLVATLR